MPRHHIAIFMYSVSGGGVPRRNVTLANGLAAAGRRVDLVVLDGGGDMRGKVDPRVRVIELRGLLTWAPGVRTKRRWQFQTVRRPLARYLARERPDVVLSADNYANLAALAARRIAKSAVPIVVSQRNNASASIAKRPDLVAAIRRDYPLAEAIVAVSEGVAADLVALGLPRDRVRTIYNPVIEGRFQEAAAAPADHPWFGVPGRPLLLGAGRIGPQKDFETLIHAFARLRETRPEARLVILGEGKTPEARPALKRFAETLGVAEAVDLPGRVPDAVPYIARADLFVLSSRWEGLPGVLIEALGCGTPIVSTDCPSGPMEILDGGRFGRLVPVGDAEALADAMAATLAEPVDRDRLKARAELFTTEAAVRTYLALFDGLEARGS
ncbi:glycosyltransferase [Methylopila musalis]|uniref:Glycosyltransferase n=1 Tax=Methylopila musalis TaxID=1134781 RepID=A0ABW3Z8G2_9HYPH